MNTVYPATAYIKGFLNTLDIPSFQVDLSLEVLLKIFTSKSLRYIFDTLEQNETELSDNAFRIFTQREKYIHTIDIVISFLQDKNHAASISICGGNFLPKASRFDFVEDLDWAFGTMGTHDKAKHLATLYLEDLGDLFTEVVDENFGFSRYAESLGRTATHFDSLFQNILEEDSYIMATMKEILGSHLDRQNPDLVCISIPFPGNVFGAFKCGQLIKQNYPHIKVAFGGGYVNTELRSVYDARVFEFVDFITLDDGEAPLQHLIEYIANERSIDTLKRTFCRINGQVIFMNGSTSFDVPQKETGTPDYSDLNIDRYLSVIEVANPMHRLWSDGWWNKLTLAHGCYWGKCSFCDVTLDYIKRYEPLSAVLLCDRIEEIIAQTGRNGFHFVDEAAPPALMRDLSIEILRRGLIIIWWANIRFEKSFTPDLCRLLRQAGCIAISGGLEVASDRLLQKMKKGVSVAQVASVTKSFTDAGIMVHTYLMYGFPTQTVQETVDSLEMVRQMFDENIIQSGFWHLFAMTAHSPVGLKPEEFGVLHTGPVFGGFAENDYFHEDPEGADHEIFSQGLKTSLLNYMQGTGLDEALDIWFDFEIPKTTIAPNSIKKWLQIENNYEIRRTNILLWIGGAPIALTELKKRDKKSKHLTKTYVELEFSSLESNYTITLEEQVATWVVEMIEKLNTGQIIRVEDVILDFEVQTNEKWSSWLESHECKVLRMHGLLFV
mgnify:FL=1